MSTILLPNVPAGYERWHIHPVWIRDGKKLHAIAWVKPDKNVPTRFYLVSDRIYNFDGGESDKASVCCGRSDAIGLLEKPKEPEDICRNCCHHIVSFISGKRMLWSKQLAADNLRAMIMQAREKNDPMVEWALSRLDVTNPDWCVKMLNEIVYRAPNRGTIPFNTGIVPGVPDVMTDCEDEEWSIITAASALYSESAAAAAAKSAQTRRENAAVRRSVRETFNAKLNKQVTMF